MSYDRARSGAVETTCNTGSISEIRSDGRYDGSEIELPKEFRDCEGDHEGQGRFGIVRIQLGLRCYAAGKGHSGVPRLPCPKFNHTMSS